MHLSGRLQVVFSACSPVRRSGPGKTGAAAEWPHRKPRGIVRAGSAEVIGCHNGLPVPGDIVEILIEANPQKRTGDVPYNSTDSGGPVEVSRIRARRIAAGAGKRRGAQTPSAKFCLEPPEQACRPERKMTAAAGFPCDPQQSGCAASGLSRRRRARLGRVLQHCRHVSTQF